MKSKIASIVAVALGWSIFLTGIFIVASIVAFDAPENTQTVVTAIAVSLGILMIIKLTGILRRALGARVALARSFNLGGR
jgi:hypothetical protein